MSEEDDRLQRIKFLVDQSKLYSQFLSSSIEESKSKDSPAEDGESRKSNGAQNGSQLKNEETKISQPVKRRKRVVAKKNESKTKNQATVTDFFKPPPKHNEQPKAIVVPLHPYQIAALKWLTMLYQNGLNGILADEMGLGKTLEVIAFIAFLLENGVEGPFLVLSPLSTLGNWCNELTQFAPSITWTKYYGTPPQRTQLRRSKSKWGSIVLSSYEIIMADAQYLNKVDWKYIIVDEGHRLKNIDSKLMKVLKGFSSANRMLLTGTPLQNSLTELWALLNFLLPDVFTDLSIFHSWFESGEVNISSNEEDGLVSSLHDILRPFLLRRLKRDVGLNLPSKREYVVFAGLTELQQKLYKHFLDGTAREFVVNQIVEDQHLSRKKSQGSLKGDTKKTQVAEDALIKAARQELRTKSFSNLMMQLRLCCNSPYLFWYPEHGASLESTSGKLQLLQKLMCRLKAAKHKVLIFTQFTKMLDLLEDWSLERGYTYFRLDGSVSQENRQDMIDKFADKESDIDLFMLTTRSGGQGVNLVAADTVILFDSDWNPQQDLQAMDRVHRIGQTRPVIVLRLCIGDTVEQDLLERAAQKLELNHLVIESGEFQGPTLTKESNEQKIKNMDQQLQRHRMKFDNGSTVQIEDSDFDKMLDRSSEAYENANVQHKLCESIYCVRSEL